MKLPLRRALIAALALGAAALACTSFESEPATSGDGGTTDAHATTIDGAASDATALGVCATTFDARACVDFEPGATGYGATARALNVVTALEEGGPPGSVLAQHARTMDAASASSYELKATFDTPFTVSLDFRIHSLLAASSASTIVLNIASANGSSRIYLNAHAVDRTFELSAEVDGTLDGSVQAPALIPVVTNLPFDTWINLRATVKPSGITYDVNGVTVPVLLPPTLAPFGPKSLFAAGPATVKDDFDVLVDNLIVR